MTPDHIALFNNAFWFWVFDNYSFMMLICLAFVTFCLKLAAIFAPSVPSNNIIELMKGFFKDASDVVKGDKPIEPQG